MSTTKMLIDLRFGFWKKSTSDKKDRKRIESSSEEDREKESTSQGLELEETKVLDVQPPQDEKSLLNKLEENQNYVVMGLTTAGGTLVLKSGRPAELLEEVRNEIAATIEENKRLKQLLQNKGWTESDEYLLAVGNFHYFRGVPHDSLEFYDHVLERNPDKISALNNKGVILDNLSMNAAALECYDKALKMHSENAHIWFNRGVSLYREGRYEESLESFGMTLRMEPLYSSAVAFKAHTLSRLGRKNEAFEFYNRALLSDPDNAELLYNKARICSSKCMNQEALATLEKAIGIDPRLKAMAAQDESFARLEKNQKFLRLTQ